MQSPPARAISNYLFKDHYFSSRLRRAGDLRNVAALCGAQHARITPGQTLRSCMSGRRRQRLRHSSNTTYCEFGKSERGNLFRRDISPSARGICALHLLSPQGFLRTAHSGNVAQRNILASQRQRHFRRDSAERHATPQQPERLSRLDQRLRHSAVHR